MNDEITKKKLREFGILLGIGFPIIIGWLIPKFWGHDFRSWTLFIGFPSLFITFIKPTLLLFPYKFWMKIGYILGWINSRIILSAVFLFVLLPISFIMKLLGYDPLRIKKNSKSFKEIREIQTIDLTRIF